MSRRRHRSFVRGFVPSLLALVAMVSAASGQTILGGSPSCALLPPVLPDPAALVGTCPARGGARCRYASVVRTGQRRLGDWEIAYPAVGYDVAELRRVTLRVRVPRSWRPGDPPLPVVLFSHGGASGTEVGHTKLAKWAEIVAKAGYVAINLGHTERTTAQWEALCPTLDLSTTAPPDPFVPGGPAGTCGQFKFLHYDRPHDVAAVLDRLGDIEAEFAARGYLIDLDPERVVVAGHSAGAGSSMMLANAGRLIGDGGEVRFYPDERPIAYMGFSPQGPGTIPPPVGGDGFFDASWDAVRAVPVFTATGTGDDAGGEDPFLRREAHYHMNVSAPRYQLFVCDASIPHTGYALESPVPNAFKKLLASAAVAFLDAVVRGDANAQAWLASDNALAQSRARAEWSVRP